MLSARETFTLPNVRPQDIEESDDGNDGQRRGANKRRSHGIRQRICEDHGYTYHWTSGLKPHLTKNGKKVNCNIANYVPFVVPGLSTSSSTSSSPASSTSSSQDTVISTENAATERCEVMSEESRGNPSRGSPETEKHK